MLEHGTDVFIRFNEGLSILKKVVAAEGGEPNSVAIPEQQKFSSLISARKPFGLPTTFQGRDTKRPGDIGVYTNKGIGYASPAELPSGSALVPKWKLFIGYAAPGTGNKDTYPHRIISTPFVGEPGSASSETYLAIGPFDSREEAENARTYLTCRLTRLLILLHKPSQHVTKKVYSFVPLQDWSRPWSDADLYAKYDLTTEEIAFIEKIVRPMDGTDEG